MKAVVDTLDAMKVQELTDSGGGGPEEVPQHTQNVPY